MLSNSIPRAMIKSGSGGLKEKKCEERSSAYDYVVGVANKEYKELC